MAEIHVGDIGTVFEVTVTTDGVTPLSLVGATGLSIFFKKPDLTVVEKAATFVTDGSDGKIQYTTILNDIDQAGNWTFQAKVVLPTGTFHSSIGRFKVKGNL